MTSNISGTTALDVAIAWAVKLSSGTATDSERCEFAIWQAADPGHGRAWEAVKQQLQMFEAVRERGGTEARKALSAPSSSRRKVLQGALGVFVTFGVAGFLLRSGGILDVLCADLTTGIGRRRQVTLADGSMLMLDAHSAVDVNFSAEVRHIRLLQGQLFVRVAHDASRPLVVSTRDGTATALGTAFCVSLLGEGTCVAVVQSRVGLRSKSGQSWLADTGSVVVMQPDRLSALAGRKADSEVTWLNGYVTAINRPLAEVVQSLRPYLHGFVTLSPEAAAVKVTGMFPLDNANATIAQIAQTLPVSVTYHTDYLIQITAR